MTIISNINQAAEVLAANNIRLYTFASRVMYDNYIAQVYMQDFKADMENQSLWFEDRNGTDYLVIFESEKLMQAPYYKISNLRKMSKQALYDLCENYEILDYFYSDSNFKDTSKQALISELMKYCTNEKHYIWHYNESRFYDLENTFSISGYSQGQACKVLLVGKCESYLTSDHLTNLFYDSPLVGEIIISLNGEEIKEINFHEIEGFNDYDFYDKALLIDKVKLHFKDEEYLDLLIQHLTSTLPTSAPYAN